MGVVSDAKRALRVYMYSVHFLVGVAACVVMGVSYFKIAITVRAQNRARNLALVRTFRTAQGAARTPPVNNLNTQNSFNCQKKKSSRSQSPGDKLTL